VKRVERRQRSVGGAARGAGIGVRGQPGTGRGRLSRAGRRLMTLGLVGREPGGDRAAAAGEAVQGPGDDRVAAARGQGRPRACEARVLVCVRERV
jgi:hypothetical protein